MVLWTAAILAALGLAWFIGAVVVPVMQVRSAGLAWSEEQRGADMALGAELHVQRLGSPAQAASRIRTYLHWSRLLPGAKAGFPRNGVGNPRRVALYLLTECGAAGVPVLLEHTSDRDADVRWNAVINIRALVELGSRTERTRAAVPALIMLLDHPEAPFRSLAAEALGEAGREALSAVPQLEALSKRDSDSDVRAAAAEALKSIRDAEPAK